MHRPKAACDRSPRAGTLRVLAAGSSTYRQLVAAAISANLSCADRADDSAGQDKTGRRSLSGVHALRAFLRVCGNCRSGQAGRRTESRIYKISRCPHNRGCSADEYRGEERQGPKPGDDRTKARSPVRIRTFRPRASGSRFEDRTKIPEIGQCMQRLWEPVNYR